MTLLEYSFYKCSISGLGQFHNQYFCRRWRIILFRVVLLYNLHQEKGTHHGHVSQSHCQVPAISLTILSVAGSVMNRLNTHMLWYIAPGLWQWRHKRKSAVSIKVWTSTFIISVSWKCMRKMDYLQLASTFISRSGSILHKPWEGVLVRQAVDSQLYLILETLQFTVLV